MSKLKLPVLLFLLCLFLSPPILGSQWAITSWGHDAHGQVSSSPPNTGFVQLAGGGLLMTIGAGALVLAFMDPEPTTKLSLMVGGGIAMVLAGGSVVLAILITRSRYTSVMRRNPETGQYEWILEPGR